ncbi:ASN_collapsed_G0051510.mRNA.1.CDS.1 [Saccharomyces cerevisiae]|nr:ASN_collapsed_G0051510.mRNA.1.CDS.1 [Saccharomyces cerevisiae]
MTIEILLDIWTTWSLIKTFEDGRSLIDKCPCFETSTRLRYQVFESSHCQSLTEEPNILKHRSCTRSHIKVYDQRDAKRKITRF